MLQEKVQRQWLSRGGPAYDQDVVKSKTGAFVCREQPGVIAVSCREEENSSGESTAHRFVCVAVYCVFLIKEEILALNAQSTVTVIIMRAVILIKEQKKCKRYVGKRPFFHGALRPQKSPYGLLRTGQRQYMFLCVK